MSLVILCSGQGRQHPDMFALTGDAPEAAGLFAHAATLLGGRDPRAIVRTDTSEALHHNRVGQILCTLQALAAATALRDKMLDRLIVAGYSVGEVAAWGVAGLLSMTDTLDLVARRGSRAALEALADEAKAMNATRVVAVPVQVASHTKRLATASAEFRESLSHVPVKLPPIVGTRLLSGVDGSPVIRAEAGLDKLAAQISQTVQWADCLQGCMESGATAFLELGPGPALSEMLAGTYRDVSTRCLEDFKTLQGARAWLAHHAPR